MTLPYIIYYEEVTNYSMHIVTKLYNGINMGPSEGPCVTVLKEIRYNSLD